MRLDEHLKDRLSFVMNWTIVNGGKTNLWGLALRKQLVIVLEVVKLSSLRTTIPITALELSPSLLLRKLQNWNCREPHQVTASIYGFVV